MGMPVADPSFTWQDAAVAFVIVAVAAFLVTWIVTDLLHVRRTPYIAILTLTTFGLTAGYLAWSGTRFTDLVTSGWGWAIVAGCVAAAAITPGVRRLPAGAHPVPDRAAGTFVWEAGVYGIAEALLLATLPVLAVWQGTVARGWTETTWGAIWSGALAVVGALVVILVHHLGYEEFRRSKEKLRGALAGCGVQALAFVLTGSALAPVIAHIVLHAQLLRRGIEMPPAARDHPTMPDGHRRGVARTRHLVAAR
jgi:hypothetical protein